MRPSRKAALSAREGAQAVLEVERKGERQDQRAAQAVGKQVVEPRRVGVKQNKRTRKGGRSSQNKRARNGGSTSAADAARDPAAAKTQLQKSIEDLLAAQRELARHQGIVLEKLQQLLSLL